MDLYAYKREQGFETVVAASTTSKADYEKWFEGIDAQNYTDKYQTDMMTHLTNDEFQPFQSHVFVFEHESAEQQQAFIDQHNLLVGTRQRAIDRMIDMINWEAPDYYDINETRTIEEIHGLDKEDKFDRRSEEDKAYDEQIKKQMKELAKEGKLTGDSFAPAKDSGVYVNDIRTSTNADGTIDIDNVLATKVEEGETRDNPYKDLAGDLNKARQAPPSAFDQNPNLNGNGYIFGFCKESEDGVPTVVITEKKYFEAEGCLECVHVSKIAGGPLDLPGNLFEEVQESEFLYHMSEDDAKKYLVAHGLEFSQELEDLINS